MLRAASALSRWLGHGRRTACDTSAASENSPANPKVTLGTRASAGGRLDGGSTKEAAARWRRASAIGCESARERDLAPPAERTPPPPPMVATSARALSQPPVRRRSGVGTNEQNEPSHEEDVWVCHVST